MSIQGNPYTIHDSSLIFHLDAANIKSYVSGSASWYDLSGNSTAVTLSNGPTFDSGNGGSIIFDGSNDYADFTVSNLSNVTTVEMWAKLGSGYSSGKMFFGWGLYDVWTNGGSIGYNTANGDVYGISSATATSLGVVNNWRHYVFEMRSDVSYTNNKIWINAGLQTLSQQYASENSSLRNFNGGLGRIACWRNDLNWCMPMNVGVFKVYNRSLTATEVLQNYDAVKSRFGL